MKIQNEIANRLGLSSSLLEDHESRGDRAAAKLYSTLSKKKFVLLLDDIWDRVDLEVIGVPHPNTNNKSKVIFTTRSEAVCGRMEAHKKMRVECLNWPEAWKLFQDKVGEEALNSHPEIPEVAENVAKECAGLPLALITIGRAMASKKTPQEWRYAITILKKSASEFSGMEDEVYSLLKFSYDALPDDTIRSCFLYCSLFPEDHSISNDQLIHYWIGEGLLDGFDDMDEAQNRGYDIIGSLKLACLLESIGVNTREGVKMHDVIRDLALWIGCECGKKKNTFFVRAGVNLSEAPEVEKWIEAKRISLMFNNIETLGGDDDDEIPSNCPNLLTLIISQNSKLSKISDGFFQHMKALRFLDLSRIGIKKFPMSIVELVELQYLNLSETRISKLPQEIKKLVKLKYLILSRMYRLKIIPRKTLSRFSKLQILDLTLNDYVHGSLDAEGGGAIIEELECLKDLKWLSITMKNAHSLERLLSSDKFKRCAIELYIYKIRGLSSLPLSTPGILKSLTRLVCVECSDLEDMAINCTIKEEENHLQNLHYVRIESCNALKDLSWLRGVPKLARLEIYHCKDLEIICDGQDEHAKENPTTFACLKSLELEELPKQKSICWLSFPSDIKANVTRCPSADRDHSACI